MESSRHCPFHLWWIKKKFKVHIATIDDFDDFDIRKQEQTYLLQFWSTTSVCLLKSNKWLYHVKIANIVFLQQKKNPSIKDIRSIFLLPILIARYERMRKSNNAFRQGEFEWSVFSRLDQYEFGSSCSLYHLLIYDFIISDYLQMSIAKALRSVVLKNKYADDVLLAIPICDNEIIGLIINDVVSSID